MEILIIGGGIGGLTLGLMLHRAGIACRVFEATSELKAVGVGINILPHASRELCATTSTGPAARGAASAIANAGAAPYSLPHLTRRSSLAGRIGSSSDICSVFKK